MTSITEIGASTNLIPHINQNPNPDFNYRAMNRSDLMSLSTIKNEDSRFRKFKQIETNRDWSTNLYNLDIEGSVPKKFGTLHQKTDFINKVDDIEKTSSKILHFPLNKAEYNLNCKDIFKAYPQCNTLFVTKRNTNPLEPKYQLSKVESVDPPMPRFIRDSINVDGIEGARPKKYFQWETRKMFDNSAIEGNSPKRSYIRSSAYSNLDYSDVTHNKFKTKRCVNPLDPVYQVDYGKGENYTHGRIEGSKPVTFLPYEYKDPLNLKTNDIQGCQIGSKNHINKFKCENNFNLMTKDIRGASAGSLKKGISTQRQTNPLNPAYAIPQVYQPFGIEGQASHNSKQTINENNGSVNLGKENVTSEKVAYTRGNSSVKSEKKSRPNFDPEKFKKPEPFYGFSHDKYLISSNPKTNSESRSLMGGSNEIQGQFKSSDMKKEMNKESKEPKISKNSNFNEYSKQSYAQLLDRFIKKNPDLE